MPCYSPLKGWKDEETGGLRFTRSRFGERLDVACGQCLGCRLDRARMWSARLMHEASCHDVSWFVTLTYDDAHLPVDRSVDVRHFQLFMKRLRKWHGKSVRFFHVGEYGNRCAHGEVPCAAGCRVGRPHYHAIVFGLELPDVKARGARRGNTYFESETLAKLWGHGFCVLGSVTVQSAGYVARYCLKKVNGVNEEAHYVVCDGNGELRVVRPEYCTMSRRPGIGSEWFSKYGSDVFPSDEIPIPGSGVVKGVPRFYEEILKEVDPELYVAVRLKRQEFFEAHADGFSPERLIAKYHVKRAAVRSLAKEL